MRRRHHPYTALRPKARDENYTAKQAATLQLRCHRRYCTGKQNCVQGDTVTIIINNMVPCHETCTKYLIRFFECRSTTSASGALSNGACGLSKNHPRMRSSFLCQYSHRARLSRQVLQEQWHSMPDRADDGHCGSITRPKMAQRTTLRRQSGALASLASLPAITLVPRTIQMHSSSSGAWPPLCAETRLWAVRLLLQLVKNRSPGRAGCSPRVRLHP